ncbi:MAG: septal ring lytic transglycosylase RlpA family protein [Pseudomonadota bacterium]
MKTLWILAATGLLVGCSHQDTDTDSSASAAPIACAGASYYADSLAGNPTASGEPYIPSKLTAAHRTLSFGTKIRVVREGRGEVTVTINDRGPFIDGRIIDLSRAAAEKVDLITDGVGQVCIYAAD